MDNRMTPQGTAQIRASAGKVQIRNTVLLCESAHDPGQPRGAHDLALVLDQRAEGSSHAAALTQAIIASAP
jgi:hypothetical protein